MNDNFQAIICKATEAEKIIKIETIQVLWSGYGRILRVTLHGSQTQSVVVKHVKVPIRNRHPRGWNTNLSHMRKLKSYEVELAWYENWSRYCNNACRIPNCLALESYNNEVLMVLEDLDASGFSLRRTSVNDNEIKACLNWLANFHASFLGESPDNLWEVGTYWHLDTRPDELNALMDHNLKKTAKAIDLRLRECEFQTFVHGDAKLANFCFSPNRQNVAAVDFQYVGGGCGMKDIAYFIGSCLHEEECDLHEVQLLDFYFKALQTALEERKLNINLSALEKEWRNLYSFAWTDFHRFIKGWSPDHWKINSYSERIANEVVNQLLSE